MKKWLLHIQFERKDLHYYVLLLSAPVLLTVYRYFFEAQQIATYGSFSFTENHTTFFILQFISFFFLVCFIPIVYLVFTQRHKSAVDFLKLGDWKSGTLILSMALPITCLISYASSLQLDFMNEYPLSKHLNTRNEIIRYEICYTLFYYISWEFFFRGFLLFGLKDRYGIMTAILIQTISSCLVHIGKPAHEILASIPAGIIFGAIAIRTGSIWYTFTIHAVLGVGLDLFILFK